MRTLEFFFDYACPYCRKGYNDFTELIPEYPDIEVVWRPCEAHPRPEVYGRYSDLCVQAFLFADGEGAVNNAFHTKVYAAALDGAVDIENPEDIAQVAGGKAPEFLAAIKAQKYAQAVLDCNDYAYEENGVWYLPAFRMDGRKLDSEGGVGVSREALKNFLEGEGT
ncbi:MAG: DsbA family protein [Oscillospiraceae bacterium]|nr:DsbA family protein [Oscillospiraceae bacterium]